MIFRAWSPAVLALSLSVAACGGGAPPEPDAAVGDDAARTDDVGPVDAFVTPDGGPSPDASFDGPPRFRNPVDLGDLALAREALRILGAPSAGGAIYCTDCHGLTRQTIRHWRALSDTALATTLTDLEVTSDASAAAMVASFRGAAGSYDTTRLGVFSTAAQLNWFRYVFMRGAGPSWETELDEFLGRAAMPPLDSGHAGMTQAEFDVVAEWFIRGVPSLEAVLPADPAPTECTPGISADVAAHGDRMALEGWGARNEDSGLLMHDCPPGAASPTECFPTATRARDTTYGASWDVVPGTSHRVVFTTDYSSAYWTRSSADGRYVSHGAHVSGAAGRFIDLQTGNVIVASGSYDPSFFPDNSGFVFHGRRAYVCTQNVLGTGDLTLSFTEPGCSSNGSIGLYEHVGAALMGGDYWSVHGLFVSDDGAHEATLEDPATDFGSTARTTFTRLTNDGSTFRAEGTSAVATPFEGDGVMSPSSELVINRVSGPGGVQLGYVLRRVRAERGAGTFTITAPEIARYCFSGGKPGFSFDERWMVIHHYVGAEDAVELGFTGPDDPAFAAYRTQGGANVYLVELATGARTRLTHVQPGQYALFPHFRSDGWIYFLVRTLGETGEHIVASDAWFAVRG